MKAHVIIGANFGDEGKGMTTDCLCRKLQNAIVIRFNGGAQAGHTVVTPQGERKVFSHLGSGTFTGTPTYLSEFFIANPVAYLKELESFIDDYDTRPLVESIVHIHPDSPVTTPFDVMFNWALENSRRANNAHHGSCGLGINETVTRHCHREFRITVSDLKNQPRHILFNKLQAIRDSYYYGKMYANAKVQDCLDKGWNDDVVIETFLNQCHDFIGFVRIADYNILERYDHLVFEGAQGLLLDEDHRWFPHVTRSKTGLPNAQNIMLKLGISEADVYYITRSYLTRHGAGPLPNEVEGLIYPTIEDQTNINNHFQGSLRFAPLDLDLLRESVERDLDTTTIKVNSNLVMTCINQLPEDECLYTDKGVVYQLDRKRFLDNICNGGPWNKMIVSSSPTYEHFSIYKSSLSS